MFTVVIDFLYRCLWTVCPCFTWIPIWPSYVNVKDVAKNVYNNIVFHKIIPV